MPDRARLASLLREAGFRATPRRVSLIAAFEQARKPLSVSAARDLAEASMDTATAYRAIKELAAAGILRQVDFRQGFAAYEIAGPHDHHHLVCVRCRRVEDFACDIAAITRKALRASRHFRSVDQHALELFGVCRSCAPRSR